ncbi:MAG TPA: hypothetical protein VF100_07485, partial [Thermoanaerobaculia bacterium]
PNPEVAAVLRPLARRRSLAVLPVLLLLLALVLTAAACGGRDAAAPPADEAGTAAGVPAGAAAAPPGSGGLTLAAESVRPGEPIAVTYRLEQPAAGNPWVGLVPADVESTAEADNDAVDVTYESVPEGSASGTLRLAGQAPPGRYRLRLFAGDDEGSAMLAETPVFEVREWSWPEGEGPRLTLSADEIAADDELVVTFELPEALPEQAWLAVVPATVTSREEPANDDADVGYEYVSGTSGEIRFRDLPPGGYVVRLFPCDDEVCSAIAEVGPLTVE